MINSATEEGELGMHALDGYSEVKNIYDATEG